MSAQVLLNASANAAELDESVDLGVASMPRRESAGPLPFERRQRPRKPRPAAALAVPAASAALAVPAGRAQEEPTPRVRTSALREFLTLRRSSIPPASLGIQVTKARRSGGLTREDMAELTGVSFKWYTLFESGVAKGVSRKFAERVAKVLGLDASERPFLLGLMGFTDPVAARLPARLTVPEDVSRLVRESGNVGMALYSPLLDVLEANAGYASLFPPAPRGPAITGNLVWRFFMDPGFQAVWGDWSTASACMLAHFRCSSAAVRHTPEFAALMAALEASAEFRKAWSTRLTARMGNFGGRFEIRPPGARWTSVNVTTLQAAGVPGLHIAAWMREPRRVEGDEAAFDRGLAGWRPCAGSGPLP